MRVTTFTGGWDLEPVRNGRATHAVYRIQIDLAGSTPLSMVSDGAVKDLPRFFDAVRLLAVVRAGGRPG